MRVLLLGDIQRNDGPSNVHRMFVEHWPKEDSIDYIKSQSKAGFIREGLAKGIQADIVISMCMNSAQILTHRMLHAMGKTIVCFNHGYVPFENAINDLGHSEYWLEWYRSSLRQASLVVANSRFQADFVLSSQPELKGKTTNILLGVDRFEQMQSCAKAGPTLTVTVSGGNRLIKGNDVVLEACRILRGRGTNTFLKLYGDIYEIDDPRCTSLKALPEDEGRVMGQVDHDRFVDDLNRSNLFVMDSRHEPFGLSVLDALRAGCSVLISKNCGVLEALSAKDSDVIEDCEDVEEVAEKIAYLLEYSNARRLYESIDFDEMSWNTQVGRLRWMCAEALHQRSRGRCWHA